MIRLYIIVFFSLLGYKLDAQVKLYYFITPDSTRIGVKDESGKIIISPIYPSYVWDFDGDDSKEILSETIEFYGLPIGQNHDFSGVAVPTGAVYNRAGDFLYHAQYFDNGPDYWKEGLRRYVENDKMGFVDKSGVKVTSALWDFISPFNYGYAKVMEGDLKKVYDSHGEHWSIGSDGEIVEYLINKKGRRVEGYSKAKNSKDYFYEGKYYPYPFEYTVKEQQIIDSIVQDSIGLSFLFRDYKGSIQLEIVEFPNFYRPYYVLQCYESQYAIGYDSNIFVDDKTLEAYLLNYSGEKVGLRQAMIEYIEGLLESNSLNTEVIVLAKKELKRLKSHP